MKGTVISAVLMLFVFCGFAQAEKEILITEECVYLDELTAPSIPHSKVTCGFMPGESKSFPKEVIENYLRRAGINAKVLKDVTVTREGEKLSSDDIVKAAQEAYKKAYPDVTVSIEQVRSSREIFAEKSDDFQIKIDTSKFGSTYAEIHNGLKKTQIYMYVRAFKDGYVASERIKAGESLEGKTRLESVDITTNRNELVTDMTGLLAAKTIAQGRVITAEQVQKEPALAKGEKVKLVFDNGSIRIETAGVIEENAFVGKPVQVRNITSQQVVTAEYIGNGIVKAYF